MKLNMKGHQIYMSGDNGPFRCDNCEYYVEPEKCNNDKIISLAKENKFGLTMDGEFASVDADGCSDEFKKR